MNTQATPRHALEDVRVNIKVKLAAIWATLMFMYIYIDHFHLFMPGTLKEMLAGKVFVFDITQGFLVTVLASMTIPALMIFLSVALPANVNRWTNVIIASVFIPYTLFNITGVAWAHMWIGAIVEVVLLCLIIRYAWKWPRLEM
ncbi:MAG: hypothetical protein IAE95_11105 [Chitinophagaceae bacterium]|nr:hypothetical protein [Chitinophagaceae bacterium]